MVPYNKKNHKNVVIQYDRIWNDRFSRHIKILNED